MERDSVLIVGSGMMGCGIASCSALAGERTVLYDAAPQALERAKARAGENLAELAEISARRTASPLFKQMLDAGVLGYKSGKGFYDWSQKDMDALVKRRNDFIVHALKTIRAPQP